MVPLGFLVSRTVGLQNLAASVAASLSGLLGIQVLADGASLRALDGSFNFEVNGGCSGIRSLTAMTMLAALYVHFTQDALWKKVVIFCSSLFFALLGNLARIFSVVIFAKFIDVRIAATIYHDWSGFIFFPFAVGGMVLFSNLLNRDWEATVREHLKPEGPVHPREPAQAPAPAAAPKPGGPISYDY
jgi:exosortase